MHALDSLWQMMVVSRNCSAYVINAGFTISKN